MSTAPDVVKGYIEADYQRWQITITSPDGVPETIDCWVPPDWEPDRVVGHLRVHAQLAVTAVKERLDDDRG